MTGQVHNLPERIVFQPKKVPPFTGHANIYPEIAIIAFRILCSNNIAVIGVPVGVAGQVLVPVIDPA